MSDLSRPTGKEIIKRLEAGKLPEMVNWFDPFILGMVAVRTLISSTIGQYADQRPMQEAADGQRDMNRLTRRHDYSVKEPGTDTLYPPDADPDNPYFPKKGEDYKKADPDDRFLMDSRMTRRLKLEKGEDMGRLHRGPRRWLRGHLRNDPPFARRVLQVRGATRKDAVESCRPVKS